MSSLEDTARDHARPQPPARNLRACSALCPVPGAPEGGGCPSGRGRLYFPWYLVQLRLKAEDFFCNSPEAANEGSEPACCRVRGDQGCSETEKNKTKNKPPRCQARRWEPGDACVTRPRWRPHRAGPGVLGAPGRNGQGPGLPQGGPSCCPPMEHWAGGRPRTGHGACTLPPGTRAGS